jgi:hypothetical protein
MRGLFINNKKARDSIYESGLMVFNCLKRSNQYHLEYIEISFDERTIPLGYDFYFFNYHPSTMYWMDTSKLKQIPGLIITMVMEVLPDDPFVLCPDNHFNGYCVLDPTIKKSKKVFAFPRPLELNTDVKPYIEKEVPHIGSFGFATRGKGFQHVVEAVNKEFEQAVIRINIPYGDFVPNSKEYAMYLATLCKQQAKKGIEVQVTHEYMNKKDLLEWCSQNTINCFLYDRNMPGLAATTDQAIAAGRPLSISKNDTFRHILSYLPPYPEMSLKEAIKKSQPFIKQMQKDWSSENFTSRFEKMLEVLLKNRRKKNTKDANFELPVLKGNFIELLKKRFRKYKRFLSFSKLSYLLRNIKLNNEKPI